MAINTTQIDIQNKHFSTSHLSFNISSYESEIAFDYKKSNIISLLLSYIVIGIIAFIYKNNNTLMINLNMYYFDNENFRKLTIKT